MQWSDRPVLLLGHGIRAAGVDPAPLMELGVPVLTSWQAKDLVDNFHPNYFGSPGIYGQRMANKVLYEADQIVAIGNRMSLWNVGHEGPRADQQLIMVDCDEKEVKRFQQAKWEKMDIRCFIGSCKSPLGHNWGAHDLFRHPIIEEAHNDAKGFINSYRFTQELERYLGPKEIIVTDMGAPLICAHQVLSLKPPQRLMTSGGLGEMGCGLPAAIGASFATNKGSVLCLTSDGSMMLNLQELQTIVHHKLPIKIIVYENGGYDMIRKTQDKAGVARCAVDAESGVSLPNYRALAHAFGMAACDVFTWKEFYRAIPALFASSEPSLVVYHMDPEQPMVPKLDPIYVDGVAKSPRFCDMSPRL